MSELLPTLPGAGEVNPLLVDRVVARLNQAHDRHGMALFLDLGRIVVDMLFEGDARAFETRAAAHRSFAAVLVDAGLRPTPDAVKQGGRLVHLMAHLPAEVSRALKFTHHRMLLAVDDTATRVELAERAAAEGWTTRVLQDEVARLALARSKPRRGRRSLPPRVRGLRSISRTLDAALGAPLDAATLRPEHVPEVVERIEDAIARLQELLLDVARLHPEDSDELPDRGGPTEL